MRAAVKKEKPVKEEPVDGSPDDPAPQASTASSSVPTHASVPAEVVETRSAGTGVAAADVSMHEEEFHSAAEDNGLPEEDVEMTHNAVEEGPGPGPPLPPMGAEKPAEVVETRSASTGAETTLSSAASSCHAEDAAAGTASSSCGDVVEQLTQDAMLNLACTVGACLPPHCRVAYYDCFDEDSCRCSLCQAVDEIKGAAGVTGDDRWDDFRFSSAVFADSRCTAVGVQTCQRWSLLDRDNDCKLNSGEFWLSVQCQAEFWRSIGMLDHFRRLQVLWRVPKDSCVWASVF